MRAASAVGTARYFVAARAVSRRLPHLSDLILTPAWDMLLMLFVDGADIDGVGEEALLAGTDASPDVATRWLAVLEQRSLIVRSGPEIVLTGPCHQLLERYFTTVGAPEPG